MHSAKVGLRPAVWLARGQAIPPYQAANDLDIPDKDGLGSSRTSRPGNAIGARGIGEPPVGGGCAAILNALSDALGDEIFRRAPVTSDVILASLEAGRPAQHPLRSNI